MKQTAISKFTLLLALVVLTMWSGLVRSSPSVMDAHYAQIAERLPTYVDAVYPEVEQIGKWILANYDRREYFFLDIGSGPVLISSYLKNSSGVSQANVPLSGFADRVTDSRFFILNPAPGGTFTTKTTEYVELLRDHFTRFIPAEALSGRRKILIIDSVQTGNTLVNAHRRISEFVHEANAMISVEALGLLQIQARIPEAAKDKPAFRFYDMGSGTLSQMMFNRTFQKFSVHTRFEPGRQESSEVEKNPAFDKLDKLVRDRMRAHPDQSGTSDCETLFRF